MSRESRTLLKTYLTGFILALSLTITAFFITSWYNLSEKPIISSFVVVMVLVSLAVAQLIVQLLFFFHLGKEAKPRLNTVSFLFMLIVVCTIGFGSIWIMYNLSYNMSSREVKSYIQKEENIKP